jgi:acyl carrier protein
MTTLQTLTEMLNDTGIPSDKIKDDALLIEDLYIDSLDHIEIVMQIENEWDIEISNEEAEKKMRTVGDTVRFIDEKVQQKEE